MREEKDACSLQWLISLRWVVPYIHEYIISYLIYVHIYNTLYYVYHTSICLDNISTNIKTCICLFEVDVQENCSKQRGGKRGMKTACSWTIDNVSVTCLLCLWTVFWSNDQHLDPAWMCPISFYMFIIYNIYMVDPQDDLEVVHLQVETNIFHFSAAISACEKANHWQLALEMVQQMRQAWKTSPTHMVFPGTASRAAFLPFNLCMFISLMIVFNLTSRSLYVFWGWEVSKQPWYGLFFLAEGSMELMVGLSREMQCPRKPSHKDIIARLWEAMKPQTYYFYIWCRCYHSTSPSPWDLTGSRHGQRF